MVEIAAIELNLHKLLHQAGLHLEDPLLALAEGNRFYTITRRQEQENFPDVFKGMIKVFTFNVYTLLDPGESLFFLTPYVANQFEILPEKLCEPFCVSAHVGEFILAERVYFDCPIPINQNNTIVDLVELDMVDFDVILGMD